MNPGVLLRAFHRSTNCDITLLRLLRTPGRGIREKPDAFTMSEARRCASTSLPEPQAPANPAGNAHPFEGKTEQSTSNPTILGGCPMADQTIPGGSALCVPTATERSTTEQKAKRKTHDCNDA
jgi:hypothetical protein